MKFLKLYCSIFLISFPTLTVQAQPTQFNINAYRQFLQANQNMTTSQLLNMHPAGLFNGNLNLNYQDALYFDTIAMRYNLTDYEKLLLQKNGFMVTERLKFPSYGTSMLDVYHKDLPVFVSADAILHAYHISYDRILKTVELEILIDRVTSLLNSLHAKMPQLAARYEAFPQMNKMLRDVDLYLTVPRRLLNPSANLYYVDNSTKFNEVLTLISEEQGFVGYTLFSDSNCVVYDWSQFKPRGHYVDPQNPILEKYFRAMIWLGRTEIYLLAPVTDEICPPPSFEDIRRQTIDAFLIRELFDLANANSMYEEIEGIIKIFVGEQDNVTLKNIISLASSVQATNASQLFDDNVLLAFQDSLKNQPYAYQLILSQILANYSVTRPDSIVPASAFLLFGQRFVIDSYATGSVVFDRISFNSNIICRLFPSTLDPIFALGNDAAAQLLKPELDQYFYSSNLAALRYLINSYGFDFWDSTLYNLWLNSIRKLNPPADRNNLPQFMQTAAYWQEKINTQLTSWAQLRHDNLLYAKQSYTGVPICSFPYSYVEPFPELYSNLKNLSVVARNRIQGFNFAHPYTKTEIMAYFDEFYSIMDTLKNIAQKELDGVSLSDAEMLFLKKMIYEEAFGCAEGFNGWYSKLFYSDHNHQFDGLMKKDHIVADIHTVPADCGGGIIGAIPHVGTGDVNLGVFITKAYSNQDVAFVGPVSTYYEYTTYNFLRLTDQEWESTYLQSALRPSWVNIYLADSSGNSKGNGPSLITGIENDEATILLEDFVTAGNYPNPFNPETIIWFKIPSDLTNSLTELAVYNLNGELIIKLVNDILPTGNYIVKWNGQNAKGKEVSSGVYFYHLKVADKLTTGKMVLMR